MRLVASALQRTHQWRAAFWAAAVPVCFALGLHDSLVIIFLWSSYANFAGDLGAWVAQKAKDAAES